MQPRIRTNVRVRVRERVRMRIRSHLGSSIAKPLDTPVAQPHSMRRDHPHLPHSLHHHRYSPHYALNGYPPQHSPLPRHRPLCCPRHQLGPLLLHILLLPVFASFVHQRFPAGDHISIDVEVPLPLPLPLPPPPPPEWIMIRECSVFRVCNWLHL